MVAEAETDGAVKPLRLASDGLEDAAHGRMVGGAGGTGRNVYFSFFQSVQEGFAADSRKARADDMGGAAAAGKTVDMRAFKGTNALYQALL